jgi:hypothetical protein
MARDLSNYFEIIKKVLILMNELTSINKLIIIIYYLLFIIIHQIHNT